MIHLKATGNAPILVNSKLKLSSSNQIMFLAKFIREQIKGAIKPTDTLVYFI